MEQCERWPRRRQSWNILPHSRLYSQEGDMEMKNISDLFTPGALSQIFQLCHKIKAQSAGQLPQCLHSASSKGHLCHL